MPGLLPQNSILKKTIIFRILVKVYDAYQLWELYKKYARQIKLIDKDVYHFFIFPFYHTGGAEKVHADIVNANSSKKQIVFFTGNSYNDQNKQLFIQNATCIELFPLLRNNYYKKKILAIIIEKLNKTGNNIVFSSHSKEFYSEIVPEIYKKNKCIDLIHSFVHEGEPGAEYWSMPVIDKLNKRVVIGNEIKNMLLKQYRLNNIPWELSDRIEVIHNYVDISNNICPDDKDLNRLNVIYVGRISAEKRVEEIIEIANRITRKNNICFYFIGPGMEQLTKSTLSTNIHFVGNLAKRELDSYYELAHIIMLLSSREGIPIVLMEAMAMGVVPVTTNVGGIPELVEHDKTGLLIENDSDKEIRVNTAVENILLLNNNRPKLHQIGMNAYTHLKNNFSKDLFNIKYKNLLKK